MLTGTLIAMPSWPISPSSWKFLHGGFGRGRSRGSLYGPGPLPLAAALEIAEGMGMSATNCEGHIGFADLPGETDTQLGIIGHMDGARWPGWTFEPFKVTEKDGFPSWAAAA